jgi:hypothetical protein
VQKALRRAGTWCAESQFWDLEKARGANACFRDRLVVRVVVDAVAAIVDKYPTW